ncbi:hypothetical protein BC829DRAFT_415336 [Chytridium lagenaria]|nr:hypothetical protein BC829DRAFT_415336 [Chytridium lagenaria]
MGLEDGVMGEEDVVNVEKGVDGIGDGVDGFLVDIQAVVGGAGDKALSLEGGVGVPVPEPRALATAVNRFEDLHDETGVFRALPADGNLEGDEGESAFAERWSRGDVDGGVSGVGVVGVGGGGRVPGRVGDMSNWRMREGGGNGEGGSSGVIGEVAESVGEFGGCGGGGVGGLGGLDGGGEVKRGRAGGGFGEKGSGIGVGGSSVVAGLGGEAGCWRFAGEAVGVEGGKVGGGNRIEDGGLANGRGDYVVEGVMVGLGALGGRGALCGVRNEDPIAFHHGLHPEGGVTVAYELAAECCGVELVGAIFLEDMGESEAAEGAEMGCVGDSAIEE